jgi:hypothetical protein
MSLVLRTSSRALLLRTLPWYRACPVRYNSTLPIISSIPISDAPTFEEFKVNILPLGAPRLLRSCITHWPALARWADLANLKGSEAGAKPVPIEVARIPAGGTVAPGYNAPGQGSWDRVEMPLDVFLDALAREVDANVGDIRSERWTAYLAQYALLDEVCSNESVESYKLTGM